jgi:peptidyl-prolyl cis-trans isomerase D
MLRGMRKAGQSLVGKIIATVLFGILILSFAIWGIGDIFRGAPPNTVAKVGRTEITIDQFRTAYNNEIQRLSRQTRRTITPDQARAFGIDRQVLNRLISEAAFDQRARELGLSVSDQLVVRSIMDEPNFRGPDGQFSRALFEDALRNAGLSEAGLVRDQRFSILRTHVGEAISGDLPVPLAAREAVNRYTTERRAAAYMTLPATLAGELPAPSQEQLQSFYDERKSAFRAPEYRSVAVIAVSPESLAKPETVSDADARQRYEEVKAARFGSPEKRTVQQITFPSLQDAEAAAKRITEGATFETVAAERNVSAQDLELGTFARAEMLDPAVADAAFSLQEGAVSQPIQGRFGPVLLRVTQIQPEAVRPFEEVAGEVKQEIAEERARREIDAVHDAVEDMRASFRPLAEIAREKGLRLQELPAVDRLGRDKSGHAVSDIPEREALLTAAFQSDVGADNEVLRVGNGGYLWYDVTAIDPARDRPLEEVKADVERLWREDQIASRLGEKARSFVERLDKGDAIETVAAEARVELKTAQDLARGTVSGDLAADVVNRIFATPVGKAGSAAASSDSRTVYKVTSATVPPLITTTQEAEQIATHLRNLMAEDLVAQYLGEAQKEIGVTVNEAAVRQVVGGTI